MSAAVLRQQVLALAAAAEQFDDWDASCDHPKTAEVEFDGVWKCLTPKEQAELLRLLIQRVDYDAVKESVSITFHPVGLRSLGQRALAGELEEALA